MLARVENVVSYPVIEHDMGEYWREYDPLVKRVLPG
jgi:hypothetical protein